MSEGAEEIIKQEQSERAFLREKYLQIISMLQNRSAEIEMSESLHVTACVKSFHPNGKKIFVSDAVASTVGFMPTALIKTCNIKTMTFSQKAA